MQTLITSPKHLGWLTKRLTPFVRRTPSLWLMADTGVTTEFPALVTMWQDTLSGSGILATYANGSFTKFTNVLNGYPGIGGNENVYMEILPTISIPGNVSIFCVHYPASWDTNQRYMSGDNDGDAFGYYSSEGYITVKDDGDLLSFDVGVGSRRILEYHRSAGSWSVFSNGYASENNSRVGTINPFNLDIIGSAEEDGSITNKILEIIIFNGLVSGAERWAMRKYLGTKYDQVMANE